MPYLSVLEVCSRQGAIQIHVYLYLTKKAYVEGSIKIQSCSILEDVTVLLSVFYLHLLTSNRETVDVSTVFEICPSANELLLHC